jgi:GNAT superfamily N-acetyltransferase
MSFEIRPAGADELEGLHMIERASARLFTSVGLDIVANDEPDSIEVLAEHLALGRLWVAVGEAGVPVGYAMTSEVDREGHLDQVSVNPDAGRLGIGTALVEHACDWAQDAGFDAVTLTTYRDVAWNGPFYARLGFEVVPEADVGPGVAAIRTAERARGLDVQPRVVMVRRLAPLSE